MFIEKRKVGKSIKFYLVHSYRKKSEVRKIRRYLGLNLSEKMLQMKKHEAEEQIKMQLDEMNTHVFNFSLSKSQMKLLNKYNDKIKVHHLEEPEWKKFTEQFTYNTNAIEGSSLGLEDVSEILHKRKAQDFEETEAIGVAEAVRYIRNTKEDLSLKLIKKLHNLCFKGSKHFAGKFRDVEVVIRAGNGEIVHSGVPVARLQYALKELVGWYKKNKHDFQPLVLAAIVHNQFENIHPFQDGNGRVGRLLLNFVLIKHKYPPINIMLEDRQEYYHTLQMYSKKDDLKPTLKFLIKQYNKTLRQVSTKHHNK